MATSWSFAPTSLWVFYCVAVACRQYTRLLKFNKNNVTLTIVTKLVHQNRLLGLQDSSVAPWQRLYMSGANSEVYTTYFSPAFYGLTFTEAARYTGCLLHVCLLPISNH